MTEKLAAPMISRRASRSRDTPFNEGVSVPRAEWDRIAAANPAIASRDPREKAEAVRREVLHGELAKFRRR